MKKRNNEKEIRLGVENWDSEAPIRLNKGHDKTSRKIVTRGIVTSRDMGRVHRAYAESLLGAIQRVLREGYEYRFLDDDGVEALRLYPCVEKDMQTVFVAAQTMGGFRASLNDKVVVPFMKGEQVSRLQAKVVVDDVLEKRRDSKRASISPDMVVTCPNCGTEIRVGKQLN